MLGTKKTLSQYLRQWWSRSIVHIWVSRIDWDDYFTVLGKYIHAEKRRYFWALEGYLHPHSWKWAIPTHQVGSGRETGWPCFVKSPLAHKPQNWNHQHRSHVLFTEKFIVSIYRSNGHAVVFRHVVERLEDCCIQEIDGILSNDDQTGRGWPWTHHRISHETSADGSSFDNMRQQHRWSWVSLGHRSGCLVSHTLIAKECISAPDREWFLDYESYTTRMSDIRSEKYALLKSLSIIFLFNEWFDLDKGPCHCMNQWWLGLFYATGPPWLSYPTNMIWPIDGNFYSYPHHKPWYQGSWGQSGADRTQVGPMLAPWTLLTGKLCHPLITHAWSLLYGWAVTGCGEASIVDPTHMPHFNCNC